MIKNLKEIKSSPITGEETLRELLEKGFTGHLSRNIRDEIFKSYHKNVLDARFEFEELLDYLTYGFRVNNYSLPIKHIKAAYKILKKAVKEDYTIFLTFSGALTPADFGASCLLPLIERGIIDCITTTGANVFHEIQRVIGCKFYKYNIADVSDLIRSDSELAKKKFSRIYNIIFLERDLFTTDDYIAEQIKIKYTPWYKDSYYSHVETTTNFYGILGEILQKDFPFYKNWLVEAKNMNIPIFCGAPYDSSIALVSAFFRLKHIVPILHFDGEQDINEMAALQYLAQNTGKSAVIILGGGVPKNSTLQGEPYLRDILGLDARGFDADIQISMADVRDGGLSSCPASEGHTWGKVSEDGLINSVFIPSEILSIFPLIVYAVCKEDLKKEPKKLLNCKKEALDMLKKNTENRKSPVTAEEYDKLIR